MNCEQFRAVLPDLARDVTAGGRDELLDAAAVKEALEHADACPACDELLEEAEAADLGATLDGRGRFGKAGAGESGKKSAARS